MGICSLTSKAASPGLSPASAITASCVYNTLEERFNVGFTNPCLLIDHCQLSLEIRMSSSTSARWHLTEGAGAVCRSRLQGGVGAGSKDAGE